MFGKRHQDSPRRKMILEILRKKNPHGQPGWGLAEKFNDGWKRWESKGFHSGEGFEGSHWFKDGCTFGGLTLRKEPRTGSRGFGGGFTAVFKLKKSQCSSLQGGVRGEPNNKAKLPPEQVGKNSRKDESTKGPGFLCAGSAESGTRK